ncbi:hypothetical protein B0H19DRAFT_1068650 [Mycena capillaripes]|nr:hypothetical protein B0H19DRAFT_1068650 [Mycena capillaripes]
MPEILEAGYFFPYYIGLFIAMAVVLYGSNVLLVIGLWCNMSASECAASTSRESALLEHARSLKKADVSRGHLARWATDLKDYADAIPDTHGLMIYAPRSGKVFPFLYVGRVGDMPSKSGLVVKRNRHMPDLFRGRDPDPTRAKKARKRLLSEELVSGDASDSDDEDIDTAVILDTAAEEDISQASAGTDLSRYFWPRYVLPALSGCLSATDALATTGMKLTSLIFDPRKTIMNLTTVVVEVSMTVRAASTYISPIIHAKAVGRIGGSKSDVIFNYAAWCNYTVTWLISMSRKSLKNLTILEVLSTPGQQPFRGLGIPGWVLISIILNDPVLFCIICEAFYQFVYERALGVEKYYKLPNTRNADDDVDCSISATLKQQLGYIETLRTHGRARTHVSPLEAELIDAYTRASESTWTENDSARVVFSKARKTDMTKIPFPFDFANILPSVVKFGHLGSVIAGDRWDEIVSELFQTPAAMRNLEADYSRLPKYLSVDQLLLLKPKHQIDHVESTRLAYLFGWSSNPIADYFQKAPAQHRAQPGVDQARLSLVSTRCMWRKTLLVKMENRTGFMWTNLKPPFISLSTRSEEIRNEYTIKHIKEETKGWTVGPLNFVGHGRTISLGKTSHRFNGLCFWHPDLSTRQMLAMKASWDARSRYTPGMRKLAISQIPAEKVSRSKIKSATMKAGAEKSTDADFFAKEIAKQRRQERAELKRQIVALMADNTKARSLGPRATARVKNRSQISSLAERWKELKIST